MRARDILRRISFLFEKESPTREKVNELFSNINEVLVMEDQATEDKNILLQFRILEIQEMLRFLSSLSFETNDLQKILNKHLSLCLEYHSTESDTPVQDSLSSLHLRVLKLPTIFPDYFGFAIAKIKEKIPRAHLTTKETEQFSEILPLLLHPPLLLLDENPTCKENIYFAMEKVQQLCLVSEQSTSVILKSLLPHLHSIQLCYEDFLKILEKSKISPEKAKAQLSGVGLGFFEIEREIALQLLSLSPTGKLEKSNQHGTHAVFHCEGIFYKPNPVGRAYISPEKEFAVYSLYNLLQIDSITIAPVALTKIQNVIFDHSTRGEATVYGRTVQASFGVYGMLLQDVIAMAEIPAFLRNCLGKQKASLFFDLLLTKLPDVGELLADTFIESFDSLEKKDINEQAQIMVTLYEEELIKLPPAKRFAEFTQIPSDNSTLRDFCGNIDASKTCKYLIQALWIVKQYPEMCVCGGSFVRQCHFGELTDLCKYIDKIKKLFPMLKSEDIMRELDSMLSKFDDETFSAHFLVTMLTNPFDHKSDNLMITLDCGEDGKIRKLNIVGIDNDLAFDTEGCTKTFIYLLQQMKKPFHESILRSISNSTAEGFVLDWLVALEEQNKLYRRFLAQGVLTPADFKENEDTILHVPLYLDSTIVPNVYQKLRKLLQFLRGSSTASHWDILSHIQPGVAEAYRKASNAAEQLQEAFRAIPRAFSEYKDVEVLSGKGVSPAEAALSFIQSIGVNSFDEVTQVRLIGKFLRFFPGQSNSNISKIQIPGHAKDVASRCKFFLLAVEHGYCALVARLLEEEKIVLLQENRGSENQISLIEQKDNQKKTPFLIASSRANAEMIKLLLYYGCDTFASDMNGRTCLILLVNCLIDNPMDASAAIRLLGDYPNIPWNSGWGRNVINALHSLVDLYSTLPEIVIPLIVFLIGKGASPDLVDRSGVSPLDYAMKQNLVELVKVLIEHGAGRTLHVPIAAEFFRQNPMEDIYPDLVHYSLLLRWNLAMECLRTQSKSSNICLEGTQLGKMFIPTDLASKLFDIKGNIRDNCKFGRRNVHHLEITDQKGMLFDLYFKQHPELPGLEFAVDILFELLIGHGTSYTDLAKVTHSSKMIYPVLISQGIRGDNLQDVLEKKPHVLEKLNEQYFSEILLASMLVNFEDAKPDNFILEELTDGSFRVVGIDNDHAFVPPVCKKNGETLLVKCILYCMENMKSPIHPKAREKFLSLSPERILSLWLDRLVEKHDEYFKLFLAPARKKIFKGTRNKKKADSTFISIPFQKGTIIDIYQKFRRIQNCLRESPQATGMLILRAVIPQLGIRYEQAFLHHNNPLDRFCSLVKTQYSVAMSGRFETLINSRQILKSMQVNYKDLEATTIGPCVAKQELDKLKNEIYATNNHRLKIRTALGKGNVSSFQNIQLDTEKEKIINGIPNEFPPFNFLLFDECVKGNNAAKQKAKLLETVLCSGNYRSLHIHNCNFPKKTNLLQSSLLSKITISSPQLVSLELFKCAGVDSKMIQNLSSAPCLSSLRLIELAEIRDQLKIVFALRWLEISHCQGITELKISNTLKRLVLNHCRNLEVLTAYSGKSKDDNFRIEKFTMKACIKHRLWRIFSGYLKQDSSHFLHFENFPVHYYDFEYFINSLWADVKNSPKTLMAQDLCRAYSIPFEVFFNAIFERYSTDIENLNSFSATSDKWCCVQVYESVFNLVMQDLSSPKISLRKNQLTGTIPKQFANLLNLHYLYLDYNQLSGEIPSELGRLSNLRILSLSNNQLTGQIPRELSQLSNLNEMYLNNNQLTGEIPREFSQLLNLNDLCLSDNQLAGEIPCELGELSNLRTLYLFNNQLTGEVPREIGKLPNLQGLYLFNNQLTGQIPGELSNLPNLYNLFLCDKRIELRIPPPYKK